MVEEKEGAQTLLSKAKILAGYIYLFALGTFTLLMTVSSTGLIDVPDETFIDNIYIFIIPPLAYIVIKCLNFFFWAIFDIFIQR